MKKQYLIFSVLLIIFVGVVFILTRFSMSSILSTEGYFISSNEIRNVLFNDEENLHVKKISLKKVEYEDIFYKNLNKIYIGEDSKIFVDDDYPIYTNSGNALVNISEKTKLLTADFDTDDCYLNATITDGKLYNYNDNEQASLDEYIFLKLPNGEYVNLYEITIKTNSKNYTIPLNSIISFKETAIKYFYYVKKEKKLVYKEISGVDINDVFTIGNEKHNYGTLLYEINVLKEKIEEQPIVNDDGKSDEIGENTDNQVKPKPEKKYVKPKVSVAPFKTKIYTASSELTINDPAKRIIGGINFYFYKNDKLSFRKTYASGGKIVVYPFEPGAKYKIVGSFKYYNEEDAKIEQNFFEQEIIMGSIDELDPIQIIYENGDIYPDKIELKNIKITSDLKSEALYGFYKTKININAVDYYFPAAGTSKLKSGQVIDYASPLALPSNHKIKYSFQLIDSFGNVLKSEIKDGETYTSNKPPSVQVKIGSIGINKVSLIAVLTNDDEINIGNYRYVIYNAIDREVASGGLDQLLKNNNITLTTLNTNETYTINVYGDYNLNDGKGNLKDRILGSLKFSTVPLSSLGYFRVDNSIRNLTDDSVTIRSSIDRGSTSPLLVELLTSMTINVYDADKNVVYTHNYSPTELIKISNDEYVGVNISGLYSKSEYMIEYVAGVTQGEKEEPIKVLSTIQKFKTYKKDARVEIKNRFVNSSIIDYDVRIVDVDEAIEGNTVFVEVRDSTGKLIDKAELTKNSEYARLSYEKLDPQMIYTFKYYVESYNIGYDNTSFYSDYVLLEDNIKTDEGIIGSIELNDISRQPLSANLFNINDITRFRTEGYTASKTFDFENNIIRFSAKAGYVNYSYYLPEAHKHIIKLTFEAKYADDTKNTAPVYISNNFQNTQSYKVTDLSKTEWKSYDMEFMMVNPYIGFLVAETASTNTRTDVLFKNIQIRSYDLAIDATNDISLSYHSSGKKFSNTMMIAGDEIMPSFRTGEITTVGNYGNGYARITDLKSNQVFEFDYTGDYQVFTPTRNSNYRIELWGAAGGDGTGTSGQDQTVPSHAGRGAYTRGDIELKANIPIYIYVGGAGVYGAGKSAYKGPVGGFNGGGDGGNSKSGSGGGATDVRIIGGEWNNTESLVARIMVAAGGGGSDDFNGTLWGTNDGSGGAGGALSSDGVYYNGVLNRSYFATQTYGGAFGMGKNVTTNTDTGGAGGGYYGGVPTNNSAGGGSGGSSYISGHLGCVAYGNVFSDNIGNKYIPYKENNTYQANLKINMDDTRHEISTDDYYLRVYMGDKLVDTIKYDLTNHRVINETKKYAVTKYKKYKIYLSVKVRDRFYNIDFVEFDANAEIRSIKTVTDFFEMHTNGRYIVLNDLDIRNINRSIGYDFYGEIDFQGHKLIYNVVNRPNYVIYRTRSSSIIKNLVLDVYADNETSKSNLYGVVQYSYGTFDNVFVTLKEATKVPNVNNSLLAYGNYGTIKNFVIHTEAQMSASAWSGLLVNYNGGLLMNGYAYGENIYAYFEKPSSYEHKEVGVFVTYSSSSSFVQNIFSLISVEKDGSIQNEGVGNLIGFSYAGSIKNVYSVEDPKKVNTNTITEDPNIGGYSGNISVDNMFYASDKTYGGDGVYSTKISKLALYDVDFQDKVLNGNQGFIVDKLVRLGYYPQVILNDCMPNQDWIPLPEVQDRDLLDVTSAKEISNDGDSAIIEVRVNNPAHEKITEIGIKDIGTVEILSQEDDREISNVQIKVSDPIKYTSRYYLRKIVSVGSLDFSTTRNYGEFERSIEFSLYLPIYNLNDWKNINNNREQNYILKNDLDFGEVDAANFVIEETFTGKINGGGHTIKNIRLDIGTGLFYILQGTIENLYVENYIKTDNTQYGGLIYNSSSGARINNVHMKHVRVGGQYYVGGIVGYAYDTMIDNSSVTDFQNINTANKHNIRIGSLVGTGNMLQVRNCFANDIYINASDIYASFGIGGLVGQLGNGSVSHSYATGRIESSTIYTGGIVGSNSGIVSHVWSKVDVITDMPYTGGIVGVPSSTNVSNTLAVGAVSSPYLGDYVGRTTGMKLSNFQNNYVWEYQPFNGYISGHIDYEKFLTTEQLQEKDTYLDVLDFGDQFYYEDLDKSLPKLINSNTGELLANQKDIPLVVEEFNVTEVRKEVSADNAYLYIVIDNPNNLEIKDLEFDYLQILSSNISTADGSTIANLRVKPTRYYDNYVLKNIIYERNGQEENYYKSAVIENLRFYRDLAKFEDWQAVDEHTHENYRLTQDIDFAGKTNVKTNVSFGRLEGINGEMHALKNINVTLPNDYSGLISAVTTNMSNVSFENITLNSTYQSVNDSYGVSFGVVVINFGDIENVNFKNINIDAPNISYVGPIARNSGTDIKNVTIENNTISGYHYVGGFIGQANSVDIHTVNASGCTVTGRYYVGGVIGAKSYANPVNDFNYSADNMNVSGITYVGGVFGVGAASNSSIKNSTVTGLSFAENETGQCIGGFAGYLYEHGVAYVDVLDTTVNANGQMYVGGLTGYLYYSVDRALVENVEVNQLSASGQYTGGVSGIKQGNTINRITVKNTKVNSVGDATGGFYGYNVGANMNYSYGYKVEVNGNTKVGGYTGYGTMFRTYYSVINAKVKGHNYVGGVYGYINNVDPTNSSYSGITHQFLLANTEVTGDDFVGGYTGYAPMQLTNSMFYNTVIAVSVNTTGDGSNVGIYTPYDKEFTETVPRFSVYEGSTINGVKVTEVAGLNSIASGKILTLDQMKVQKNYTNAGLSTSYYDFSKLAEDKYPRLKSYYSTYDDIPLPEEYVQFNLSGAKRNGIHVIPDFKLYSSGVDTINLDFSNIDEATSFSIYSGNFSVENHSIDKRTFTFQYNYKDDIRLVVTDGLNTKEKVFKAKELRNLVTTFDDYYAYIYNGELKGNIDSYANALHVYDHYLLTDDFKIYDLSNNKGIANYKNIDFSMYMKEKPLYEFKYNDSKIRTYGLYSIIESNNSSNVYDNIIYVKNNKMEIIDSNIDRNLYGIIIDSYKGKEIATVLLNNQTILNIKDKILTPKSFKNDAIVSMSNNLNTNSSYVVVLYESGKAIVFDYRTGKEIVNEKVTMKISFSSYVKKNIDSYTSLGIVEKDNSNYQDVIELKDSLRKNNIVVDGTGKYVMEHGNSINNNSTDNSMSNSNVTRKGDYITYYNSISNNYEVVELNQLIEDNNQKTETEKIFSNPELITFYINSSNTKANIVISILYIFGFIALGIGLFFILWYFNIKLIVKEKRR